MKKLTLAFLYNVRHQYPDPDNQQSQLEADFDDPQTIRSITKHLQKIAVKVFPIEADEKAYLKLYKLKNQISLAFNYAFGLTGKDGYCHLPAMLEMLNIPYTGFRPLTQALIMNKNKAKEILIAHQIPTLAFQLFQNTQEKLKKDLSFPLIVKPVARGSSAGITQNSVVNNEKALKTQVALILNTFREAALVEPFLIGREFSVAMLGNPPKILPIIESDHSVLPKNLQPLDSLSVKWVLEEEQPHLKHLICPAKISQGLTQKLKNICQKSWQALDLYDYCRIDIRCDQKENPYVLEINYPGLIPPDVSTTSYFPLAARVAHINYEQLLKTIIQLALKRYAQK